MHSLRQLGIPTVAIVSLITLSILALVGIGEGFKLLVRRELQNDQRELQKRSGSTLRFTFPWDWQPPEMTATQISDAKDVALTQAPLNGEYISMTTTESIFDVLVTSNSASAPQSTAIVLSDLSHITAIVQSLVITAVPASIPTTVSCSTCSTFSPTQISGGAADTELCRNNTKPSSSVLEDVITTHMPIPVSGLNICPTETWYSTVSACTFTSISFVAAMTVTRPCGAVATTAAISILPSPGCSSTPTTTHPCPNAGYSCAECPDGWFCPPVQTSARNCPCGYGWPCVDCVQGWYCIPGPTSSAVASLDTLVSVNSISGLGSVMTSISHLPTSIVVASNIILTSGGLNNTSSKATVQCRDGSFVYSANDCLMIASVVAVTSVSPLIVSATLTGINPNTATESLVSAASGASSSRTSPSTVSTPSNTPKAGATVSDTSPSASAVTASLATGTSGLLPLGIGLSITASRIPTVTNIQLPTTSPPSNSLGDLNSMIGNVLVSNTCGGAIPCLISEITALAEQVGGQATGAIASLEGNVVSVGGALATSIVGGLALPTGGANLVNSVAAGILGQLASALGGDITHVGPAVGGTASNIGLPVAPQITAVAGAASQVGTTESNIASAISNAGALLSQILGLIPVTNIGLLPRATSSDAIKSILAQTTHDVGAPVARSASAPQATTPSVVFLNVTTSFEVDISATATTSRVQIPTTASIGFKRVKRRVEAARPPSEPVYGWGSDLSKCREGPKGLECAPSNYNQRYQ